MTLQIEINCVHCGHRLYYAPGEGRGWFHLTRHYRPHGAPFKTEECYATGCVCDVPWPSDDDLHRLGLSSTEEATP